LVELQVRAENAQSSLAIETRSLEIYQLDFDRKRKLVARKVISQSILEEAQRTLLVQQAKVQDTQNTIRLSPSQIEAQKRQIEVNESQVKAAKLNLARTSIRLPFDARIASESIEPTQFVSVGTKLATADDIGVAEINAQVPQSQFSTFARLSLPKGLAVSLTGSESTQAIIAKFGWEAKVRMRFDDGNVSWPARVIRTSDTIDPKTRTIGAIVAVDKPYGLVEPGKRPPLVKGMFVQVEISGKPIEDQIVIPRSAIRQGRVYISDTENRLRIRPVEVLAEQGADAVISSGLSAGETLVVSDLAPALEGMLLDPRPFNPSPLRPDEANAQSSTGVKRLSTGNGQ
jgi:multidrug efflux system membrane fusion protein